jgi:putative copper resistance protein D
MTGMGPSTWTIHHALTAWSFSPFALGVLVSVIGLGIWYLQLEWAVSLAGHRWSPVRTASFLTGLAMVDLALQSPIATFTMSYFQAHVIQHLLLMVVAPPLLAVGAPLSLYLERVGPRHVPALGLVNAKVFRVATHPVPVWFLYYFSMFAFFLTSALDYSMLHMWVMDTVNVGFLVTAALFWWPLVGFDPVPHWRMSPGAKLTNLLIGIPVESFLALALFSDPHPAASMYSMSSTRAGAGILWASALVATLVSIVPVFVQWLHWDGRRRLRYDLPVDLNAMIER